jgi:hypothetical protein
MSNAKAIFEHYGSAVAYVIVEDDAGNEAIGSAFHVGDGVYITARHVVEGRRIREIGLGMQFYFPDSMGNVQIRGSEGKFRTVPQGTWRVSRGPFYHPDPSVDVAALVTERADCAVIPLGTHLDDWISDRAFMLADVVIMGYPPIPLSRQPTLVAARGEVNAVVDQYSGRHPRFIVSVMARGGFSGGICMVEWDFALGVVTEALARDGHPSELGYLSVLTVEPIYVCLDEHRILPGAQWHGEL